MSLADFQPLTRTVKAGRLELTVRGLSLDDVSVLINDHLVDLDKLFELYERGAEQPLASARFILSLTQEAPALIATAIALAADEPDLVSKARKLSIPAQVELVKAILTLTFEEAGGLGKFVESLTILLKGLTPTPTRTDSLT